MSSLEGHFPSYVQPLCWQSLDDALLLHCHVRNSVRTAQLGLLQGLPSILFPVQIVLRSK